MRSGKDPRRKETDMKLFTSRLAYSLPSPYELDWMPPTWEIQESLGDPGLSVADLLKFAADGTITREGSADPWGKGSYSNGTFIGSTTVGGQVFRIERQIVNDKARLICTVNSPGRINSKNVFGLASRPGPRPGSSWTAEAGSGAP
jgi:hypothetical protein